MKRECRKCPFLLDIILTLWCITLKNGQTYFKNLDITRFSKYVLPFLNIIHERVKAEYIVIFCKHLSELYWIFLLFLDCQSIVSHGDFQHKMKWLYFFLFDPTYKQDKKEGLQTMRIIYKFRRSRTDVLHEKV